MWYRKADFKVGERVRSSTKTAKLSSLKLSYVKQVNTDEDAYIVKSSPTSSKGSNVHFNSTIYWKGKKYCITTCDCPYFLSTYLLCPCACSVCQRVGIDIDDSNHYHPRWWIGYHPLYPTALANLGVTDFENAPWLSIQNISTSGINKNSKLPHQESEHEIIVRTRTQINDSLSDMQAERIAKLRQQCDACVKLGA